MNIIKLPQFLGIVDNKTKAMSHEDLEVFIHEIARKLPEKQRDDFIDLIDHITYQKTGNTTTNLRDNGEADVKNQILNLLPKLEKINSGEVCLDSEYNEEWDDWYNSDVDEVLFSDPQKLLLDIEDAVSLVHECVDMELYEVGCELCDTVCYLEIYAAGEYNDYDGSPLGIEDLFEKNLIVGDTENFVKEALYLMYMGSQLSCRADEMYYLFERFKYNNLRLENILQMGNHELPEFDEFLSLWIEHLGKKSGRCASELLKEAQQMLKDDFSLLENARKFVNEHPELYLQLLQMKCESGEDEKMLDIGGEAVDSISVKLKIRSKIALWTAFFADKICRFDERDKYWFEALRSDTSVINYMRIKFLPWNSKKYDEQIFSIVQSVYSESKNKNVVYCFYQENMKENDIFLNEYCTILFFEQEFDDMVKMGMSIEENLGWSSTFMKEGMALLMLLLYQGEAYTVGMKGMINRAMRVCEFKKESLYFGKNDLDDKTDIQVFCEIFEKWKETVTLSEGDIKKWLNNLEAWISRRVYGIMGANRRNYYGECAEFIAAFGEVMESLGITGAKARIMEKYKKEYSRRRAFHDELRGYGMKK